MFGDKDQRLLELHLLSLLIIDEIGRDVSSIELHSLNELYLMLEGFALPDGNNSSLADLIDEI